MAKSPKTLAAAVYSADTETITQVAHIQEATMGQLVATYNSLAGKSIKKFESRVVAERRVEMAFLSAKDADGQTGVPVGTEPVAKPRSEIVQKAKDKKVDLPPALDEERPSFALASVAGQLQAQADKQTAIVPREKKAPGAPRTNRPILSFVRLTGGGKSKGQAGSTRTNVLLRVTASKFKVGKGVIEGMASVEELDKHFDMPTKGYLQKLIELEHIKAVDAEGNDIPPVGEAAK